MDPISIISAAWGIISKFIPDEKVKAQTQEALLKLSHEQAMALISQESLTRGGQIEINKVEAEADSLFKSGWRPLVGWICGIIFGFTYLILPIVQLGFYMFGHAEFPVINTAEVMSVLGGLLGLGALRTYDKKKKLDYDKKQLFNQVRQILKHNLSQEQVDAVNAALKVLED